MRLTHSGVKYECSVAVKCENDNYIKLYDENGFEIASFYDISDFSEYSLTGGTFTDPCDCNNPIKTTSYALGGRTIATSDWTLSEDNKYYYEIENNLISANTTTCDILLLFAKGTSLTYEATQDAGKVTLYIDALPDSEIVIDGIRITRI